jgi:hypothetical protein
MLKTYTNLWAIVVNAKELGEVFAEYVSAGYPPIDRSRTVLCGSEHLATSIMKMKEFVPQGRARVVPVTVVIEEVKQK